MSNEQSTEQNPERYNDLSESPPSSGPSCCCAGGKGLWIIAAVIGLSLILLATQVFEKDESALDSGATISWREDYTEALADAKLQNKPILLAFSATWCPPCKEMKKKTYPDPEVIKTAAAFVPILVDPDKATDLTRQYQVEAYPTYIVLAPDGERVTTIIGYKKAADFARALNNALEQIKAI